MASSCSKLMKEALDSFLKKEYNYEIPTAVSSVVGLGAASNIEANTNIQEGNLAPKEMAIETPKKQKALDEKQFSFKDLNVEWPEKVNPSNYKDNKKGIKDYIAKIESRGSTNPYLAKNSKSGAEGKYQILPSNYQELSDNLGIPIKDLRRPENQEKVMDYLIGEYQATLEKWNLPVNKENMFVLHNLGQTGGVRVLRGTYQPSDIRNMAGQLASNMDKSSQNAVINNYATMYNVVIPNRRRA